MAQSARHLDSDRASGLTDHLENHVHRLGSRRDRRGPRRGLEEIRSLGDRHTGRLADVIEIGEHPGLEDDLDTPPLGDHLLHGPKHRGHRGEVTGEKRLMGEHDVEFIGPVLDHAVEFASQRDRVGATGGEVHHRGHCDTAAGEITRALGHEGRCDTHRGDRAHSAQGSFAQTFDGVGPHTRAQIGQIQQREDALGEFATVQRRGHRPDPGSGRGDPNRVDATRMLRRAPVMRGPPYALASRYESRTGMCDAGRPMSVLAVVSLVVGIAVLIGGAEFLVRGASRLAARTGISSIVIGLTVVAFGTSAPELAVSLQSAFQDNADLAIGNIVGSNIANVLLVLGLAAMVGGGLVVAQRIVRIDVPLMVAVSVAVWLMALDGEINRLDGVILTVVLIVYVIWTVRAARRPDPVSEAEYDEALEPEKLAVTPVWVDLGLVVGGLVGLVLGARLLVDGASDIAAALGVPDLIVGLTVVAVGTSMPEIATSILAAMRGERDLAVGNAVGSNLFNLMCVLGLSSVISPSALVVSEGARNVDLPIMTAVAVACLPVFFNGYALKRWEGGVFVAYYTAYTVYLVLGATESRAQDSLAAVMVWFVLPLTALTLGVVAYRAWRASRSLPPVRGLRSR